MPINTINQPNDLRYLLFQYRRLKPSTRRWIIRKMKWNLFKQWLRTRWNEIKKQIKWQFQRIELKILWMRMTREQRIEWLREARWIIYKRTRKNNQS